MSLFAHRYECIVCGERFTAHHKDDALYCDACPACACEDNVPTGIYRVSSANPTGFIGS